MKALAPLLAILLIAGCGSRPQTSRGAASFAKDIQPIFTQSCMPCHAGGTTAKGNYDLTGYAGTMGNGSDSTPNVIPGNADSSILYLRVTGAAQPQMPKSRPALTAAQLDAIKNWIVQGAKNN